MRRKVPLRMEMLNQIPLRLLQTKHQQKEQQYQQSGASLSAHAGSIPLRTFIERIPNKEAAKPIVITRIGRIIAEVAFEARVDPIKIVAITEPQYDSKISAPIPAVSPTLSPTLSAIVAGFLGSSSGIPASTLPTRSAPTSAAFV